MTRSSNDNKIVIKVHVEIHPTARISNNNKLHISQRNFIYVKTELFDRGANRSQAVWHARVHVSTRVRHDRRS